MTKDSFYFDYNACAPLRACAKDALIKALDGIGNPSSVHRHGKAQRKILEDARYHILDLLDARGHRLVFTSGGTEANNLALQGLDARHVFVSSASHASCLSLPHANPLPVDHMGRIDLETLEDILKNTPAPCLVSVSLANHETGIVENSDTLRTLTKQHGALLHLDAVQAVGRAPVSFEALNADLMTISSPKIGGPAGIGALLVRKSLTLEPLIWGGGQEFAWRAGTQNTPAAAGFSAALTEAMTADWSNTHLLRDRLERALHDMGGEVICWKEPQRLPNTLCVHMKGVSAQDQVMAFDVEGFCVSAGSACASGRISTSTVLAAMGHSLAAQESIRVSLGPDVGLQSTESFAQTWHTIKTRAERKEKSA